MSLWREGARRSASRVHLGNESVLQRQQHAVHVQHPWSTLRVVRPRERHDVVQLAYQGVETRHFCVKGRSPSTVTMLVRQTSGYAETVCEYTAGKRVSLQFRGVLARQTTLWFATVPVRGRYKPEDAYGAMTSL